VGVDRGYQAISPWSEWVSRARDDWQKRGRGAQVAEALVFLHQSLARTRATRTYEKDAEHHTFVLQLLDADPSIVSRYFDSNRTYDSLHFVLSPWRREGLVNRYSGFPDRLDSNDPELILDLAMLGDEVLFGEAVYDGRLRDLQGTSARYLSPVQVEAIARALASQSVSELQAHCSRERMELAHVYEPIGAWEQLRGYFEQLRAFYVVTAQAGDAVIVSTI
jgi:hypothetical protein